MESCSDYSKFLVIIREDRKRIANLCESLEVAKSQQSEYQKAASRRARQAECAETRAKNASEMLTEANSVQDKLSSQLALLRSNRKVEKQAARRMGLVGDGRIENLQQQLRLALEENERLELELADVCGIITLFSICEAHF